MIYPLIFYIFRHVTDAEIQGHEKRLLQTEDQIIMKKKRFVKPSGCHLGVFFRDIRSKLTLKMQKRQVAKLTSAKLKKKKASSLIAMSY